MEEIINNLENLIDDIERDASLTNEEITENLYNIKQQLEDYQIEEESTTINWEDLGS